MKSNTIRKINGLGKAGFILSKIGRILLMIAGIGCLVGGILMCFVPREAVQIELSMANSAVIRLDESINVPKVFDLDVEDGILELGQNTYQVVMDREEEAAAVRTVLYLSDLKWFLFAAVLTCAAACATFYFAGNLCAYFKDCDSPFSEEISQGLVRLAWSLIPVCVLSAFLEALADSLGSGTLDLDITIDLTTILLILCIFMLSYIFKHGTALQTESDETL